MSAPSTVRRLAAVWWWLAILAPPAVAQPGAVEGTARADSGDAPIAFALVRLLGPDSAVAAQGITNADGRFRFARVAAGNWRVQLLRIGFRPVLSDAVQIAAGQTAQLSIHAASQ